MNLNYKVRVHKRMADGRQTSAAPSYKRGRCGLMEGFNRPA